MFAYPFKNIYLKSHLSRYDLAEKLTSVTYLSDANFKKSPNQSLVFFGEVSPIDFNLEHISKRQKSVNFVRGNFLGAENDMYIFMRLGAWQHQRVYFLLIATLLTLFGFLTYYALQAPHGFRYPEEYYQLYGYNSSELAFNLQTPIAITIELILVIIAGILYVKYRNFQKTIESTLNYFKGLWQAEIINAQEAPLVFRQ